MEINCDMKWIGFHIHSLMWNVIHQHFTTSLLKLGMSDYISTLYVHVIKYARPNRDAGLAKLCLLWPLLLTWFSFNPSMDK